MKNKYYKRKLINHFGESRYFIVTSENNRYSLLVKPHGFEFESDKQFAVTSTDICAEVSDEIGELEFMLVYQKCIESMKLVFYKVV